MMILLSAMHISPAMAVSRRPGFLLTLVDSKIRENS
jgi:hypothetical protein